jgi:hypothetical protein
MTAPATVREESLRALAVLGGEEPICSMPVAIAWVEPDAPAVAAE